MYLRTLSLIGLLAYSVAVEAQSPPAQPGQAQPQTQPQQQPQAAPALSPEEQQKAIEGILATWEADAKGLQSLFVAFVVEQTDVNFNNSKTYSYGEAKVLKLPTGQYGLKLETFAIDAAGKPDMAKLKSKYVCSGTWFYNFDIAAKTIFFQRLQNQNMRPDDGPFAFLFGMKALEAKGRFDMSVIQQDAHYTWLKIIPKTAQDQRDFTVAQLGVVRYVNAISPKDFPLKIMWREPGRNLQSWDFKSVIRNDSTKVNMTDFNIEGEKKQGWQIKEAPAQTSQQPMVPPGKVVPAGANVPRK